MVLTSTTLEVYDIRTFKLIEHVLYDSWSLVSPILGHTTNGSVSYSDAVTEVAHSVRVYKGKIFLLVSVLTDVPMQILKPVCRANTKYASEHC